ncbi:MAG: hypothetical protein ACFCVD_25365 [Nodosilinea sp.]
MRHIYVLTAACATLLLSSCGQPSVKEAQVDFCQELAGLGSAIKGLTTISSSSTVGDLKTAEKEVQQAMAGVSQAADTVQAAKVDELNAAYQGLNRAINDISNNQNPSRGPGFDL